MADSLPTIIQATTNGKIQWKLHDNGNGYHAGVDGDFRLDLVDGTYTLRRNGIVLETQSDTNNALLQAIGTYIDSIKSEAVNEFLGKITEAS
jgi:hypothetical protein